HAAHPALHSFPTRRSSDLGTHAASQTLYGKPLYNAATDFAPVALNAEQPIVLIARRDYPANNLQDFIAYAKANQTKMQYGSAGRSEEHTSELQSPCNLVCR